MSSTTKNFRSKGRNSKIKSSILQTTLAPHRVPGERLMHSDILISLDTQNPVTGQYYTGRIGQDVSRAGIECGDTVTISKTDILTDGCYVATRFSNMEPDNFQLNIFKGFDNHSNEYVLDDPTKKEESILRVKYRDIKSMHRIIHVVKTLFVDDLV